MSLSNIKTEALAQELIDRMSDQILDPEPMYDGILSFLDQKQLEDAMDELQVLLPETTKLRQCPSCKVPTKGEFCDFCLNEE